MKRNLSRFALVITLMAISFFTLSCGKEGLFSKPKTIIQVEVIDNSGDIGECNIQLWWNPDGENEFMNKRIYPLDVAVFEDVNPGQWRCQIGTVGETNKRFTVTEGQTIVLTYERYIKGYLNIGWVSAPIWGWRCTIN